MVIGTLSNTFCLDVLNLSINSSLDVRTNMVLTQNVYKQARCRNKLWVAKYILLRGEKSLRKQENAYLGKTFIHRQFLGMFPQSRGVRITWHVLDFHYVIGGRFCKYIRTYVRWQNIGGGGLRRHPSPPEHARPMRRLQPYFSTLHVLQAIHIFSLRHS